MINVIDNGRFRLCADNRGAELSSFCDIGGAAEYEYIWQKCNIWNSSSPLLFPVVGRLREDVYHLAGRSFHLGKHGFARTAEFDTEELRSDEMVFLLRDSAETRLCYPFPFELRVAYRLRQDGFTMEHSVQNTGDGVMYFSIGAHPGFRCEMGDRIVMDTEETASAFRLDKNALRGRETYPVFVHSRELTITPVLFEHDALIFDGLVSRGASLLRANGRSVHVDFGGAPCLGLWAKPGAKYVCIEPWYGIDDRCDADGDFVHKERILSLASGAEFMFTVAVTILEEYI